MRCRLCKKRLKKKAELHQAIFDRGQRYKAKHFHKKCWKALVLDFMSIAN